MSSISCNAAVACSSSAFQISHVHLATLLKANQQKLESQPSKVTGEGKMSLPAPFYFWLSGVEPRSTREPTDWLKRFHRNGERTAHLKADPSSQGCWMPHTTLVYSLPFLLYVLSSVFLRAWGTLSPCGHPYINQLKFLAHPPHPGSGRVARLTVFPPFLSSFLSISTIVSDTGNSPLSEGNS